MSTTTPSSVRETGPAGSVAAPATPAAADRSAAEIAEIARSVTGSAALDDTAWRRYLHGLPGVDKVGADGRAAMLGTRSVKTTSKAWALDTIVRMVDLTTLEGADTPGKVRALAAKAVRPEPDDPTCPSAAAVCVYNDMVPVAVEALAGTGVKVAAVSTAFPSGRASRAVRLADTREAVEAGADEIDMVIDRGAFLSGRYGQVYDDIVAVREVCRANGHHAHLKVILETGELATYDNVRRASWLAMLAGVQVGVKPAGGIKTSKDAIKYLVAVNEVAGAAWLDPDWFRFGASSLLNDVLMQRNKLATGTYWGPDYVTVD